MKNQENNKMNKAKKTAREVTLDELFECLNFYADKDNYNDKMIDCSDSLPYFTTNVMEDRGSKARKILKKLLKEELEREGIENNL